MLSDAPTSKTLTSPLSDERIATHDGFIWPVPRNRMVTPACIQQRMLEDLANLAREAGPDGTVSSSDMGHLGWSLAQVITYGDGVAVTFRNQRSGALETAETIPASAGSPASEYTGPVLAEPVPAKVVV